jgi:hypothetical protein
MSASFVMHPDQRIGVSSWREVTDALSAAASRPASRGRTELATAMQPGIGSLSCIGLRVPRRTAEHVLRQALDSSVRGTSRLHHSPS